MDKEFIADIRNKLQSPKTALEFLSEGKEASKEFIEIVRKKLNEAIKVLENK